MDNITYKEEYEPEHIYTFFGKWNGISIDINVKAKDISKYKKEVFIQRVFPGLSPSQGEWLMSGMHDFQFGKED